jgi:HEAT repeat protein
MSTPQTAAPPSEAARLLAVQQLAALGLAGVDPLIEQLTDPSWVVRRSVIAALAQVGPLAVGTLCRLLQVRRDSEARVAAAVDVLSTASGDVDEPILELLADGQRPAVICDAAAILGRRRSGRAVPALARLTTHDDDNVAVAAIEALGRIGGAAAVDSLVATVQRKHFFRTFPALDVLGRSGQASAVAPLAGLLTDPLYAAEAARALGHTGDERAVTHLVPLLGRAAEGLSRVAAVALCEIDERIRRRHGVVSPVEGLVSAAGLEPGTVAHLAAGVEGAALEEQAALCRILGLVGGDAGTAALLDLIEVAPQAVAAALPRGEGGDRVRAKVRLGPSATRLLLLPLLRTLPGGVREATVCLSDPDPAVRVLACEILAREGETAAVEALFERLGDEDPGVVHAAVGALQSLGTPETEERAVRAAASADPRVRHGALRILGFFGRAEGVGVLLQAASSTDDRAREIALAGLALSDDARGLQALLDAAAHPRAKTRAAAVRAMGNCPVEATTSKALQSALQDTDAWVRYYAVQALGRRREDHVVDALLALLSDPAGQVHVAVIDALARMRGEAAATALRTAASASDPDVRRAALVGLGSGQRTDALPLLLEAATSPDASTRNAAASAIAAFESPRVVPALLRLASDPDAAVSAAAVNFLAERPGVAASQALLELVSHEGHRDRVVEILRHPRVGRVVLVVAALQNADERRAPLLASILAGRSHPDAEAALLATLYGGGVQARRAAAAALVGPRSAESEAALEHAAVADDDLEVRRLCTVALARR